MSTSLRGRGSAGFCMQDFRPSLCRMEFVTKDFSPRKSSNDGSERKFAHSKPGTFFLIYFPYQADIAFYKKFLNLFLTGIRKCVL